jgi:hypothetical protein
VGIRIQGFDLITKMYWIRIRIPNVDLCGSRFMKLPVTQIQFWDKSGHVKVKNFNFKFKFVLFNTEVSVCYCVFNIQNECEGRFQEEPSSLQREHLAVGNKKMFNKNEAMHKTKNLRTFSLNFVLKLLTASARSSLLKSSIFSSLKRKNRR